MLRLFEVLISVGVNKLSVFLQPSDLLPHQFDLILRSF